MLKSGLKNSLNAIREISSEIYHQYVPVITEDTNISQFAEPILNMKVIQNEFINALMQRVVYTQFNTKYFNNKLKSLEGDRIPLGYAGQEIYVNPAKARQYNVNDFAGLLQKYEADVKVQYLNVNTDLQYCVSIARHKLKQAFVSWEALDTFIGNLTNSLYNGAYIDSYNMTKMLVSSAYKSGNAVVKVINKPTTQANALEFSTQARELFLNFSEPTSNFNSWAKVGGEGKPVVTWTDPEDVVFLVRNDILAYIDVNVLANAFHIEEARLMGNIIGVNNFDVYNDDGTLNFDGSNIMGIMADRSWFKIKEQDMFLDEFYNANNRVWNYYLNMTKMYEYSLFANAVIFATAEPTPEETTDLSVSDTSVIVKVGETEDITVTVTPLGNEVTASVNNSNSTATLNNNTLTITGVTAGNSTVTLSSGSKKATVKVSITTE